MTEHEHADPATGRVAELDRRFYALALDHLAAGLVLALAAAVATTLGSWWARASLLAAASLVVVAVLGVLVGRTCATPGKAALGLRVLDVEDGRPVGVGRGLARQAIVAAAGVPTFGLGLATLAWTAVADPAHRRRGWHDRLTGAWEVDVRPVPVPPDPEPEPARPIVNLTAARLLPGPSGGPGPAAYRSSRPAPVPGDDAAWDTAGDRTVVRPRTPVRWSVRVDTGESFIVEGLVLLGRGPTPRAGEQPRQLVGLRSTDLSLSKTHAQLEVIDSALVLTDRGSTNGTVLVRQGVARDLSGGQPTTVLDGDRIRVGDRELTVALER